jgi:ArsR family transcriptional regulator, arsenate/arsenite/antimonite-responsive transcriptional repressor
MEEQMATKELELAPVECCTPVALPDITPDQATTLAVIFKALADPSRVQIVNALANTDEPVCVCDLQPLLRLSQGTVSFHLKKLLDVGLLEREQRGTWAYYSLNREGFHRLADVFTTKEDPR